MNVEIARTLPPARRRGGRLTPPVYDPGHKSCFDVRINPMPRGPIIAQRQETHLFVHRKRTRWNKPRTRSSEAGRSGERP